MSGLYEDLLDHNRLKIVSCHILQFREAFGARSTEESFTDQIRKIIYHGQAKPKQGMDKNPIVAVVLKTAQFSISLKRL